MRPPGKTQRLAMNVRPAARLVISTWGPSGVSRRITTVAACGIVAIGSRGCVSVRAMSDQFHDLLAEILAGKQADKGLGRGGQALRDGLAVLEASAGDALGQLLEGRRPEFQVL